jgi:3-oxoadipate enol-lactonase
MPVLVHAGICDIRMWDSFELPGAVRHELRGYGETPPPPSGWFRDADDLEAALDGPSALVGASFGGLVCLDVAARSPRLVTDLVLLDAPLPDHDWSREILEYEAEEERLLEAGDLDGATELSVSFWAPAVAEVVRPMQRRAFELQAALNAEARVPDTIELGAVTARTLVAVGDRDHEDFHRIAERLAREIPDAEHAVIEGAGHLPSLEQPRRTAALVRAFLGLNRHFADFLESA